MASNPAFNRLERDAQSGYAAFNEPGSRGGAPAQGPISYAPPGAPAPQWGGPPQSIDPYQQQTGPILGSAARVTMDDVIMKTMALFALVLGFGAIGWSVAAANPAIGGMLWMGGMVGTLVLGLVIAFKKSLSVPLIIGYAVLEGVFVGAVSQFFQAMYPGVVATAVLATVSTFVGMFLAYKTGLIKVTSKFRKIMTMAIIGYALFAVVNFGFAMVSNQPFGFGGTGGLGIAISLFAVGLASLSLALDFDQIDQAIATGAPQQYSWLLAHGLIVTVVWLYIEFLRLFARFQSSD